MSIIELSNAEYDFKEVHIKAIAPNKQKLLIYINDTLVLDYDGTSTMYDEWHALEYNNKLYDMHIYFDDKHVILYSLNEVDNNIETDYESYITIPIDFKFDINTIFVTP